MLSPPASTGGSGSSYWRDLLDGAPTALDFPVDHRRPDRLSPAISAEPFAWPEAALADLKRQLGVDEATLAATTWLAFLCRHADRRDVVLGVTGDAGDRAEDCDWAVIRVPIDADESLATLAGKVNAALSGPEVRRTSVEAVVEAIGAEPRGDKHPIFQTGLRLAGSQAGKASLHADRYPPCDLTLVVPTPGEAASIEYAPELFEPSRIRRMTAELVGLVRRAARDPAACIHRLPVVTDEERSILKGFRGPARTQGDVGVAGMFAAVATRSPDADALEFGDETVTYADLDARSERLRGILADRGVGPGSTVAISLPRSISMIVSWLAVLKTGAAYLPVDPAYPEARRDYMLEASGAAVLVSTGDGDPVEAGLPIRVRNLGSSAPPPALPGMHGGGYVMFTSGSTGKPKAVGMPQQALVNLIEWQLARPDFAAGARTLQFASLSFDVSFQEIATTLCSGGVLVLVDEAVRRSSPALLDHVRERRVARMFLPFVALRGLIDAAVTGSVRCPDLREVYTAGEQLVVDDAVRRFFAGHAGCILENQYGPTETHVVTAHRLTGPPGDWPPLPPIGKPIDNAFAEVLDAGGLPAPIGVPGELFLGGACLAAGYVGRPDLTAERFVERDLGDGPERLYRTGDLARWLDSGELEFLGRLDSQVKFRGYRIEPGEIASVLSGFSGVQQCVAAVVELPGAGPRLVAWAVPRVGERVDTADLFRLAKQHLPDYMVPTHYSLLDALPKTPSGKVDMANLPPPAFDRGILGTDFTPPATPTEDALVAIWQDLLGVTDIGRHDNFFDLGGDSLIAVEMFMAIGQRFGRELPLGALAADPTVAGLAAAIEAQGASDGDWRPLVPLKTGGGRTPLFCVHGGSGNIASFPKLARALPADQPVYALQWDGLRGVGGARSIEEMANTYLAEIRSVQPRGPYLLAGQCIGGLIAREIAHRLVDAGERVDLLVMYESPNLWSPHFRHFRSAPVLSGPLRHLLNRPLGFFGRWIVAPTVWPKRHFRMWLQDRLRIPQRYWDRNEHGAQVMIRAVWRHRVRPLKVPTLYIHSGIARAEEMGLFGAWSDGTVGWSDHVGPEFETLVVDASHNGLPYHPHAIRRVEAALSAAGSGAEDRPPP